MEKAALCIRPCAPGRYRSAVSGTPTSRWHPGHSVERQNYVVLRGHVVHPVVYLRAAGITRRVLGKGYSLYVQPRYLTPSATAAFASGSRRVLPGGRGDIPLYKALRIVVMEVTARRATVGPLVAVGAALCPGRRVLVPRWTVISRAQRAARIPAPCSRPRLWLIDYGWVGQPLTDACSPPSRSRRTSAVSPPLSCALCVG